ncbi:murein biosynthesis integral membrane protein MurJ [Allorhizocola rhizosphaerae]|uniref:murein biosynthesis integral membrane protein MurJ n=1 Tax=Allorhizocola rhizosphaerae TaxID=1872709 RepID=UPI0013C30326|nr:lipid II flippase MurJ [Allorhizocola rhizosphaerae]
MGQTLLRGTIAGAATLIAVLTVASRVFGFARNVVFTLSVGPTELGDIYLAANTVPNVVFEIVAGGALASLVVPLLAGPVAAGDRQAVKDVTSGLLTWTLLLLVPLAGLLALLAGPVIDLLAPGAGEAQREAGTLLLQIFAPQLPLYGIGIVLTGVLQAHRRFAWPVIAPLLSSVTVITTYLAFAAAAGTRPGLESVQRGQLVLLAVGTTLGVVVLSLCLVIPVSRLRIGVRPTLELPSAARGLALAGAATVVAQQLALLVVIRLALAGPEGSNVAYNLAQTFYLLPWAVLAVPAATAAYPSIVTSADRERLVARTGSAILWLSCLGATGLVVLAHPISGLVMPDAGSRSLELAIIGFAPGLIGYGMAALYQRTLYAVGAQRFAALAIGLGWTVAVVAAFALSALLDEGQRPLALAVANSIGMTVLGVALAVGVARRCGREALRGGAKALTVGLAAAGAAVLVAFAATPRDWPLIWEGMLAGSAALLVFAAVWRVGR